MTPEEAFAETMFHQNLEAILSELSEREAGVLRMHLGLGSVPMATLDAVGERFSVSRERVRQIELAALRKLQVRDFASRQILQEWKEGREVESGATAPGRSSRGTKKS